MARPHAVREDSFSKSFPTQSSIERKNLRFKFSRLPTAIAARNIGKIGCSQSGRLRSVIPTVVESDSCCAVAQRRHP